MSLWNFIEWWQLNDIRGQQRQNNDLVEQNNQLLEQIRRLQLTPAQRAAEDAQRAAEDAQRAAAAKAEKEREWRDAKLILWGILGIAAAIIVWVAASQPHASAVPVQTSYAGAVPDTTPTPEATP